MGHRAETAIPAPRRWNRGNTKRVNRLEFNVPDALCAGHVGWWKRVFISLKEDFRAVRGRPSFQPRKTAVSAGAQDSALALELRREVEFVDHISEVNAE